MTILVTGGAGFIGSNFIINWLSQSNEPVVNLDKLTYAGNLSNLAEIEQNPQHHFVRGDINDKTLLAQIFQKYNPRAVIHFAAESHVDRSIQSPEVFIQTNIVGSFCLLAIAQDYWQKLPPIPRTGFRFLNISTDEVYGALTDNDCAFTEQSAYQPNNPYSATKAGADHLVRAWHQTYGLPSLTAHSSNNYGPQQHPEKLIPQTILNALAGKPLPIYGNGQQIRDWIYVQDTCKAILAILESGTPGEQYNIGSNNEQTNLDTVRRICTLLDQRRPLASGESYAAQIAFIANRLGHDQRYALNPRKAQTELNWHPIESFDTGLHKTINWYINQQLQTE